MKAAIAPSILSFNHADLRSKVIELVDAQAQIIHLDVMDGQFVPPITIGDGVAKGLSDIKGPVYEAHLMVNTPEHQLERFVAAGCTRIIFHAEATAHAHRLSGTLHDLGVDSGIAINPGTSSEFVRAVIDHVDLVLVMTVNPGWGGQAFIPSALDKVREIRSWREDVHIEVDGGIDPQTLPLARAAGANLFVVGSHLLKYPTLAAAMKELSALCD